MLWGVCKIGLEAFLTFSQIFIKNRESIKNHQYRNESNFGIGDKQLSFGRKTSAVNLLNYYNNDEDK